ncbi:MAG: hypothetical protein Q4D45_03105 [Lachnospiraceae bacterium]|nr:hypothetical protein [Lachnospiraceae bacterium]
MKKAKGKKKKIAIVIIILALILLTVIIFAHNNIHNSRNKIREEISSYVTTNDTKLTEFSIQYLNHETKEKKFDDVEVDGIYGDKHKIVQFYYSGEGIAPASIYYGFYYSPDDVPSDFDGMGYDLSKVSDNEWEWSAEGDDGGYTKKIMDGWYYYEAWY